MTSRILFAAIAALSVAGCSTEPDQYLFQGESMGSTYSIKVITRDLPAEEQGRLRDALGEAIEEVNRKMSTYREDSELSAVNRAAADEPVSVSAETLEVFEEARHVGDLTGGAFDVTVGPLVNAFGFGPDKQRRNPPDDELARLRALTGWEKIRISDADSTVTKQAGEVYCDLSALAKGYGVDRASQALTRLGYRDHMVEIGGEVRTSGVNQQGQPWRIAVERPNDEGRSIERVVPLTNLSMATSGDYRNYYEEGGVRISHTIDPRNGLPINHRLASVSVIEPDCMRADAFATALMVLGPDEGYQLALQLELAALFQVRTDDGFEERETPAFERIATLKEDAP